MALPLPRVVADVGPGGPLVTALRAHNALMSDIYDRQIKGVQAQYAPLTTQADAASKMAYANLMGPQFLAKLMGNSDVVANSPQLQDPATIAKLYQAGMGGGTGNAMMGNPMMQPPQNQSGLQGMVNSVKNAFGFGQQPQGQGGQPQNSLLENPNQGNQLTPAQKFSQENPQIIQQMRDQFEKTGQAQYTIPENQGALQPSFPQNSSPNVGKNTYAENAGIQGGIKAEGIEQGKIRAKEIEELNNTVFNAKTNQTTLDDISNILASPTFEKMRQTPILGHHELSYFAKFGTPEQQQMVGQYYTLTGNIIKDASRDFAGQFRKGEQQLLQGMKPSPGDTVDTARGKTESLSYLNKMLAERSSLTSQYMNQYHINKGQAQDMADQQVHGDVIRQNVHNKLNPTPTDQDIQYMADKYKISTDEVKKRLKSKGIMK